MTIKIKITFRNTLKAIFICFLSVFLLLYVFIYSNTKTYISFYNATKGYDVKFGKDAVTDVRDFMLNIPFQRLFHSSYIDQIPLLEIKMKDSVQVLFDDELNSIRSVQRSIRLYVSKPSFKRN